MSGETAPGRARLVLIVDDDEFWRFLLGEVLRSQGFRVEARVDGLSGLEAFTAIKPDLVLVDVKMPGMDGFEFCAELRKLPEAADVPVLLCTGLTDDALREKALSCGATDFLSKSLTMPDIVKAVRSLAMP